MSSTQPNDRTTRLLRDLTALTADLSGYGEEDLVATSSFLELGFDSLFMTQLATSFSKETGVPVTFRQLFEEIPTLSALAAYVDAALPPEADAAPAAVTPSADPDPVSPAQAASRPSPLPSALPVAGQPASAASVPAGEGFAAVLAGQVRLMSEQLQLLQQMRGGAALPQPVAEPAPQTDVQTSAAEPVAAPAPSGDADTPAITMPKAFGPAIGEANKSDDFTPRQRAGIRRLVERYNAKTATSKRRTQEDRAVHADPRTAAGFNPLWKEMVYPLVVERSKGAYLWDVDGNKYIDILNGFGPNFFGHNAPFVTEALIAQLQDSYEVGPQTPKAGEAARLLCELTGMDRVSWVNTGSEAVQAAIRISRTVTGRDKIVVFSGDYHGNFDEVLVRGTNGPRGRRTFPQAPGIPFDSVSNVIVLDYGEEESLHVIRAHAGEIAAVLVEPVQSRRPELQPTEFLKALRKLTQDEGIVLVFDEVITGFRIRQGGAQEYFGIEADLATYGKIIGGGMPIGVVAGRAKFMDTFDGGMWQYGDNSRPTAGVTFFAGTFVRHPLAITAAHASLNYLKTAGRGLQEGINQRATKLAGTLNGFFEEEGLKFEMPHFASQMFIRNKEESELATLLFYHMRDRGIHVLEGFPSYMTAAHTDEDVDTVIDAVKDSVAEMQADQLLPRRSDGASAPFVRQYPLSDDQRHLWLASQMSDEASCAFNESDRVDIHGAVDIDHLRSAVTETLKAHEAFSLRVDSGGEYQIVDPQMRIEVDEHDLTGHDPDARDDALEALLRSYATTPFDLATGPLVKPAIIRLAEDHTTIVIYCHHLIFDGYSAGIVVSQIMDRYKVAIAGEDFHAGDVVPYEAYIARTAETAPHRRAATAFWVDLFRDGVPSLVDLPVDRRRSVERRYDGATLETAIDKDLMSVIDKTARQLKISKQILLFSAFSLLIARNGQSEDFVVSIPAAGQAAEGLETVGYCVNMMPLRVQPRRDLELGDFTKTLQRTFVSALENQNFSATQLFDLVAVNRQPGRLPLSEIVFNYSRFMTDIDLPECDVTVGENPRHAVFYDLFFQVIEADGKAWVCVDYSSALFDASTIRGWIDQYLALLSDIASDPARNLGAYSLGAASQSLLKGPVTKLDPEETVVSLFDRQVLSTPDATALTFRDQKRSYRDIANRANQIANVLMAHDVGAGDIVGLMLERGPDLVAAMIGIWRLGAAWLPLDTEFPAERLRYMVTDSGATTVVTDLGTAKRLSVSDDPIILDDPAVALDKASIHAPETALPTATSRAYVLYTSGSTGKPKGVENTHGPCVNFLRAMKERPGLTAQDRLLAITTISFDISILELFLPLTTGAEIVLASGEEAVDGYDLADLIEDHDITVMQATPVTWQLLYDCGWQGKRDMKALCGGEALPSMLAARLSGSVASLWNMYGPTETTVWSSCELIVDSDRITVGAPIDNTFFYVLDDTGHPVPVGVPGVLWIGGAGVASGYLGRRDLTMDRFQADPFNEGRMYNTGDRALIRPDGKLSIIGRIDNQVKIRGHRIELGELESILATHPAIAQVVAAVRDDAQNQPMLTAYIVWSADEPLHSELRQWLRERVPDYMVPQLFVSLTALPLTANNKVDRNALPQPALTATPGRNHIAPRSDEEKLIAGLWSEMLGLEDISVTDNFFELGGQSLQVVRMTSQLRKDHGLHISPRAVIFETLEQLASTAQRLAG